MKFQTKVFLSFSIMATALIIILVVALNVYTSISSIQASLTSLGQFNIQASRQLDSELQRMDEIALQVVNNPTVLESFSKLLPVQDINDITNLFEFSPLARKKVSSMLVSINGPNSTVKRISVFNNYGDYVNSGIIADSSIIGKNFVKSKEAKIFLSKLQVVGVYRLFLTPHADFWSDDKENIFFSVIRPLKDPATKVTYGLVEVQRYYSNIEYLFNNLEGIGVYVFNEEGILIYPYSNILNTHELLIANEYYNLMISNKNDKIFKIKSPKDKATEYMAYSTSDYSGWSVVFTKTKANLNESYRVTAWIFLSICISLILITMVIIQVISLHLSKPLKKLKASILDVSFNNLSISIDSNVEQDEIIQVNQAFDSMFTRLRSSIAFEVKTHLIALQAQMSPHFLYNNLAVISSVGQEIGSEKITEMCNKLSNMLRYTSTFNENDITIKNEIDHARNYLELMKDRYENYITFDFHINDDCLNIKTPKLILQPILENCFQHGFSKISPPWHIDISIELLEDLWLIRVADNGYGIKEDVVTNLVKKAESTLSDLTDNISDMKIGGLGLMNIYIRLKLYYSSQMIFRIDKNEPSGTIVTIGGKANDKCDDC